MAVEYIISSLKCAPSAASGVAVTPSATSGANSAWFEVTASTSVALLLAGIDVQAKIAGGVFYDAWYEVDVGVGGAGSESVIATFPGSNLADSGSHCEILLPILIDAIPSGSRVAVRLRRWNETNTTDWNISVLYYEKPISGSVTTTAQALKCAPGGGSLVSATAGNNYANGSWAQLIASAAADLVIVGGWLTGSSAGVTYEIDIGIGSAGAETVKTSFRSFYTFHSPGWFQLPNPLDVVSSGNRVAFRSRGSHPTGSGTITLVLAYFEKPL